MEIIIWIMSIGIGSAISYLGISSRRQTIVYASTIIGLLLVIYGGWNLALHFFGRNPQ